LVRISAKATPNGGYTASSASSTTSTSRTSSGSSAQSSAPTSNKRVLSSDESTQGAVKHHWGTHHSHHGFW